MQEMYGLRMNQMSGHTFFNIFQKQQMKLSEPHFYLIQFLN